MLVGLDCETTGSIASRHSLVQIGIYLPDGQQFFAQVGWDAFEADPESLEVIRMSEDDIRRGPAASDVERDLLAWCEGHGIGDKALVPVGWGVSTFDLPFVTKTFPEFRKRYLSHRTVELNALCYALAGVKTYNDELRDFDFWKRTAKWAAEFEATASMRITPDWHNAGYDAVTSLLAFEWLRKIMGHPAPSSAKFVLPHNGP
ncbi:hypothetical protein [Rhodanobacter sp. C05]|uniref:hypothetical protein n=1 Tax=Rhodanobacter sp. C05 TaxID=1945855 RepID=UPI000985E77A|nr:hypothetical protein [Rhodanobacter sp. C05]OOG43457.1 hypothetical protein B0E51_01200 [Rhodanobacter sp. C05]